MSFLQEQESRGNSKSLENNWIPVFTGMTALRWAKIKELYRVLIIKDLRIFEQPKN